LQETQQRKAKFDWTGFCLLGLGLGALQTMLDRGEQMDWFTSREIVLEAATAGIALYCFAVHFVLAENPIVSPKLFRDVNFVVGTFCAALMAMTLMSTLALLTPYLQTMMNYPVLTAGLVLAPRGLGTILSMYAAGRLLSYTSARNLTIIGFLLMIYALNELMHFTTDVSSWSIIRTGFIQGASVGLIFIPLSTVSFATLPAQLRTQGTAVYSLLRNLAGAVGISVTGSLLLHNDQVNHAAIASMVTPFNQALQAGAAMRFWNPVARHGAAALDAEINRQASTIAYIDDYKLMLVVAVVSLPLLFLIRPPKILRAPDPHALME
jgi:DHA2 family multidrug resistance protein